MRKPGILIIEDDPAILGVARDLLQTEGFEVRSSGTCAGGLAELSGWEPDLLVLDLNLPDGDGLALCRKLTSGKSHPGMAVLVVTARGATQDIVDGLEAGAHDYLVKPFNVREFVARARAILRRSPGKASRDRILASGKLKLSVGTHEAWCEAKPVALTLREFDILRALLERAGQVLSREAIIERAWGPATAIEIRVIDVHISHLRAKLGREGRRIQTVPQVGFRLGA